MVVRSARQRCASAGRSATHAGDTERGDTNSVSRLPVDGADQRPRLHAPAQEQGGGGEEGRRGRAAPRGQEQGDQQHRP